MFECFWLQYTLLPVFHGSPATANVVAMCHATCVLVGMSRALDTRDVSIFFSAAIQVSIRFQSDSSTNKISER